MTVKDIGNFRWTYSSDSNMFSSYFSTANYSSTLTINSSSLTSGIISTSPASIMGNNLILSNHQHQISLTELVNMKNTLDSLQKEFHETKYKHSIRIYDLEKQNEDK